MKLQRYEKELLGLKDRITLLEELIEKEKADKNDGYPKKGEWYWYIAPGRVGTIVGVVSSMWDNRETDKYYWDFRHGSTDKAKVEWTIKHIELINEIKKYTRLFDKDNKNWFLVKNGKELDFFFCNDYERGIEWGYFRKKEEIEKIIEQFGEDYILKFLFHPTDGNYKAVLEWFADWKNEETELPF